MTGVQTCALPISDGTVSNTEFQYINSVTSNVQTQLNSKVDAVTSTDNALVKFNGTSGAIQNTSAILLDSG